MSFATLLFVSFFYLTASVPQNLKHIGVNNSSLVDVTPFYGEGEFSSDGVSHMISAEDDSISVLRSSQMKILFISTGLVGCPGNILVILVISRSTKMRRKPFNMFILHQSFVDLLVSETSLKTFRGIYASYLIRMSIRFSEAFTS